MIARLQSLKKKNHHIERTQKLPKAKQEMERHLLSGEHLTGEFA